MCAGGIFLFKYKRAIVINMNEIEGILKVSMKGTGYVDLPGEETKRKNKREAAEIDPNFLNAGMNGDKVRVMLHPRKGDKPQTGEVVAILERAKMEYVGVIEEENGFFFLVPDDKRLYKDILIASNKLAGGKAGDKVLAKITKWEDPKKEPIGEVVEVIGKPGEHDVEMRAIVLDRGFRPPFKPEVEAEAATLKAGSEADLASEAKIRKDFRKTLTFTIDPVDAKDFDDAISFKDLGNDKYEIGVHIADVSHYVRPGTKLDEEARHRATSIYLVDRTIPMLPEILSNELCSLRPNEDKLTFSAVFTIDKNGNISDKWFGRTIIHSARRFTYEEVQKILDDKKGDHYEELKTVNELAEKLRKGRFADGAIAFEKDEVKFILDGAGKPVDVYRKVRTASHLLVEDFMLLANKEVASYVSTLVKNQAGNFVYRIHDLPDSDRLMELSNYLAPLGYHLKLKDGRIDSGDFNKFLETIKGKPEEYLIQTAAVRTMAKAVYSMNNIGHYGLAFTHYTHFTSPIRRYPDVMVHRLLDIYLKKETPPPSMLTDYGELCIYGSRMEGEASEAERESIKYKQVEYLQGGVGKTFKATISGIAKWGIYVAEEKTEADGVIRLSEMKDDFYMLEEDGISLVGKSSGKRYRLGDKVNVKLIKADIKERQLDFIFV